MFRKSVLSVAIFSFAAAAQTPAVMVVEEIAAKVNGDIITRGELAERHKEIESELRRQGLTGAKLADAVKAEDANALSNQIDELLLVQRAKDYPNLSVDSDVTRRLNDLQVQFKIPDPDKFRAFVREQTGMTLDEYKDKLKREMLAQRVVGAEVQSKISVPEGDMQKYYDEHKADFVREEQVFLSQILISTEGKTDAQVAAAEARAKDLVARAKKGDKFSDLARENSDDPATAQNGGYLGAPSKRGTMRPEIEAIVFKEKKGFVTDPIKLTSPPGLLILKVEEHYEAGQASFEEVQEQIHDILAGPKMQPKLREFLTRLRQDAFLQIKDGYVDSGAAPGKDTRWQEVAVLKPQTTTKEEVASRVRPHKKVLFLPIPGTVAQAKPASETEKPPKPPKHRNRPIDTTPQAVESQPTPKAASAKPVTPMPPIKQ